MNEGEPFSLDVAGRSAVIERFQLWSRTKRISKPKGRHVVRFCADMWVARTFPGDLGIPAVWSILQAAGAFQSRRKPGL